MATRIVVALVAVFRAATNSSSCCSAIVYTTYTDSISGVLNKALKLFSSLTFGQIEFPSKPKSAFGLNKRQTATKTNCGLRFAGCKEVSFVVCVAEKQTIQIQHTNDEWQVDALCCPLVASRALSSTCVHSKSWSSPDLVIVLFDHC